MMLFHLQSIHRPLHLLLTLLFNDPPDCCRREKSILRGTTAIRRGLIDDRLFSLSLSLSLSLYVCVCVSFFFLFSIYFLVPISPVTCRATPRWPPPFNVRLFHVDCSQRSIKSRLHLMGNLCTLHRPFQLTSPIQRLNCTG